MSALITSTLMKELRPKSGFPPLYNDHFNEGINDLISAGREIINDLSNQASTLTQNDTGPVGPVTPSIYSSCEIFTGPSFFL